MHSSGLTFGQAGDYFQLFGMNRKYVITKFQRPVTWDREHVYGVIDDIEYIKNTGESVSWPSILLQEIDSNDNNVSLYAIGDGQQRIVTTSLFILAIWHRYNNLNNNEYDDQYPLINSIIPNSKSNNKYGILASLEKNPNYISVSPNITFQTEIVNKAYKSLFNKMDDNLFNEIDKAVNLIKNDKIDSRSRILDNFYTFFSYLRDNDFTKEELNGILENILTNVILSVHIYSKTENMQRSFTNMNRFGVKLKFNELIKSELYGVTANKDALLSDSITTYWNNNLETAFWSQRAKKLIRLKGGDLLDQALEQSILSREMDSSIYKKDLFVAWRNYIYDNINDVPKLWDSLVQDLELFQMCYERKPADPTSIDWEIINFYHIFVECGTAISGMSVLMKLRRSMDDKELRKALNIFIKYFFYYVFVQKNPASQFFKPLITAKNSFLKKDKFDSKDTREYFESLYKQPHQWRDKDYIIDKLSANSYDSVAVINNLIVELFIYIGNEYKRRNGDPDSVIVSWNLTDKKSREHILSQKPNGFHNWDAAKQNNHNFIVGKLGNVLPLGVLSNSKINNSNVSEKVAEYEKYKDNNYWGRWVRSFIDDYEQSKKVWDEDAINKRSTKLAEEIAEFLTPDNPYIINNSSTFKELIIKHGFKENDIFFVKNNNEYIQLFLNEFGELVENKTILTNVSELWELSNTVSAKPGYKKLLLIKDNDNYTTVENFIKLNK